MAFCFIALSCRKEDYSETAQLSEKTKSGFLKQSAGTANDLNTLDVIYIDGPTNVVAGANHVYNLISMPEGYSVTWTLLGEASFAGQGNTTVYVSFNSIPAGSSNRVATLRATMTDGINPPKLVAKKIFIQAPCNGACP